MGTNLEGSLFFNNWDIVFRNVKARDSFYVAILGVYRKVFLFMLCVLYVLRRNVLVSGFQWKTLMLAFRGALCFVMEIHLIFNLIFTSGR